MKHNLTELIDSLTRLRDAKILPPDAPVVAWITTENPQPLGRLTVAGVGAGFCNTAKATCATIKLSAP